MIIMTGLAAALPATIAGITTNPALRQGGLLNPDSAMRVLRLQDIIAAGRPLHAVMRDGSGDGTLLHWSHFLDSLLILLAAPAAAIGGWATALHAVALLAGPLSLAGLGVAIAWTAMPLAGRGWCWIGALVAGATPVLGGYGMAGVVHHHVLLAVGAVMTAGWALRLLLSIARPVAGGVALGAWAGAGLWLSPESLPFSLMAIGALWVAWLERPAVLAGNALSASGITFLAVAALAFAVDPPAAGWTAAEPDRLSLPFVLLALGAAATALATRLTTRRMPVIGMGACLAGLWLYAFPMVLRGTEGLMAPEAAAIFFQDIQEMRPAEGISDGLESLLGGAFAAGVMLVLTWRRPRPLHAYGAACALVMLALAAAHLRFAPYPTTAGAVMLPIMLAVIARNIHLPALQSAARMALVLPLLLGPRLPSFKAFAAPRPAATTRPVVCPIAGAASLLATHAGAVVLAGVNETPDLLYATQIRTVGSLYHRNPDGFMRLRAAWRSIPGDAPSAELRATRATLVLGCPGEARSQLVGDLPRDTLQDRLIGARPPTWLHRLADAGPGGYVLYEVTP